MHWSLFPLLGLLVCFQSCIAAFTLRTRTQTYDEPYYKYVPGPLQWNSADEWCNQYSGSLAVVSNPTENQKLTSFLTSLNVSQPVWIAKKVVTHTTNLVLHSIVVGNSSENEPYSVKIFHSPVSEVEQCDTVDPVTGNCSLVECSSLRGAVCQFTKDVLTGFNLPESLFFNRLNKDHLFKPVMEKLSANSWDRNLILLQQVIQEVLHSIEAGGFHLLSSSDVLYLSQMTDTIAQASAPAAGANATELIVSIATDYLNVASLILEPHTATQWMSLTADEVSVGPFTIVKSIDNLSVALADMLSAEERGFSLSTKNIDVHMKWQKLSREGCNQVFKPSAVSPHKPSSSTLDELLIPDTELQRIHSLGYEEVMFIHTHYSHLSEIVSGAKEPAPSQQEEVKRTHPGQLASAVISATVRDTIKRQTIPVAVQYTLSSSNVLEYLQGVFPVCAFWNFSLRETSGWSSDGCTVMFKGSSVTSCFCNHTTNFAVLMNYLESKWSPEQERILTRLTFIGSGTSLCALLVTLMLFTVLDIPKSDRTSIHKNLLIALICAQVMLLCSGSAIHNKVACTLVAALLHLFFMAAFTWMLVEGLLLWSKVVAVNLSEDQHMKCYYLIGWGLPVLIVTITLASASGKYAADGYCWLSVQNGVIWGFVGPVIFIIMVNIMVLARVVVITISTAKRRSIMLAMGASPLEQAYDQIRAAVKAVLVLLPILGLTWLCGILVPFSIVMAYIFILLNSFQGLFIFLIYGVYNTEVRSTVNRIKERRKALNFSNCASSRPCSSLTNSRPVSLPPETTPSKEEEACACSNTQDLGKQEERTTGQLPVPCVPKRPENPMSQTSKGTHLDREEPPPSEAEALPPGCSLHVPMELEFAASCFPRSPAPQKSYGLVCVD
ncbi:adhesion G-protein coupled receptor D2 isoform X2 [Mugil cephalus]|uniref:adhesion G-protein coupled receptor D2 isoform X2 n=1 Tax=Mugil cephalus TaxID=48193 RepID=UPI001FB70969|nr:adhesion G-protein coupled receptor D2 isoform X2 [Mugil cephalus]